MAIFNGCGAAMVTPFGANGQIDYEVLERYTTGTRTVVAVILSESSHKILRVSLIILRSSLV